MAGAAAGVRVSGPTEAADTDGPAACRSGRPAQPDADASTTRAVTTISLVPLTAETTTRCLPLALAWSRQSYPNRPEPRAVLVPGGYMQEGHVISPLRRGLASLVIDRSGKARVGVWGRGLPVPGEAVYSVRQDLRPLVLNGRPTAASANWALWGATLGGGAYVARSAIGQDAAGDLIYAGSMSAVPADLAAALARHGARIAMELDINPEWVQLDAAGRPGGALTAEIPGQYRPSGQYLAGWARDFFTVLAPPASPPVTSPP